MPTPVRQTEQAVYCHGIIPDHPFNEGQRFSGPSKGVCLPLEVQAVRHNQRNKNFKEVPIKSHASKARAISVWLMNTKPSEDGEWWFKWVQLCVALIFSRNRGATEIRYHAYYPMFVGQFWAARSPKEFSLLSARFQAMQRDLDRSSVTHTIHPQKLVIHQEGGPWVLKSGNLEEQPYFTVSFRWNDVFLKTDHESLQESKKRQFYDYIEDAGGRFLWGLNQPAYWVDLRCSTQDSSADAEGAAVQGVNAEGADTGDTPGASAGGSNFGGSSAGGTAAAQGADAPGYPADIYRMADIYRNAKFTLILLPDVPGDTRSIAERWKDWGSRMWTFPEACLSRELWYRVGNGPVTRISLQELAKLAFTRPEDEAALINAYDLHKDPLERLARLDHLKKAIWRRYHSGHEADQSDGNMATDRRVPHQDHDDPDTCDCREHGVVMRSPAQSESANSAARVYALMGFFEHRILPVETETEMQALARLSMKNDSDRIAERMVSMLPKCMSESWYVDEDAYGAHLWDIATDIQIAGVTQSGALVLEGCRAVTIHWKDFPRLNYSTASPPARVEWLRFWAFFLAPTLFVIAISLLSLQIPAGGLFLVLFIFLALAMLLSRAIDLSQPITRVEPWFIGVKGVLSANDVSKHLYGGHTKGFRSTRYTPSGSRFSKANAGRFRAGNPEQFTVAVEKDPHDDAKGHMYTLVDTLSSTIYYFRARKPPTTCLFTGREGGMGRFVFCSESCEFNELQKETVLRMPTFISDSMYPCDWVALGCRGDAISSDQKGAVSTALSPRRPAKSSVTDQGSGHTVIEFSDIPQEKSNM